ncbi:MAG: flagellar basal body rod protein FlgB [Candidatus Gastranaerophilales bacterium]|nr:flagellar basal body rod protein FlgB [Candidatus Gastranaerophilales bacterium]
MDILNKRSMEIASLAMDGLAIRHKAISSNIANSESPDYRRVTVDFEGQLRRIIDTDNRHEQNMLENMDKEDATPYKAGKNDLNYRDFKPEIAMSEGASGVNNVNIETEMADLAKTGIMYDALATLQQKAFQGMKEVIERGGRG